MKVLIYSDVHGNLPAFEKMLEAEGTCDAYFCLGDLVNYGPWSNECVDLALSLPNSRWIMGNHEEAFLAGAYPGENPLVQSFFQKTYNGFKRLDEIGTFIESAPLDDYTCIHTINNAYIYPDTEVEFDKNYIIGHSHHQFEKECNGFKLYNAGSVGQNRGFINVINYLTYDSESKEIHMKALIYDLDSLIRKMKEEEYPNECIEYYLGKKRAARNV